MTWLKRLFLKWSGHTCAGCEKQHYVDDFAKFDTDPEWQELIASQLDSEGRTKPYSRASIPEKYNVQQFFKEKYWPRYFELKNENQGRKEFEERVEAEKVKAKLGQG